jgi:hypothetical protein
MIGVDKPSFKVPDVVRLAIFDEWPNARLEKSDKPRLARVSDEHQLRLRMTQDIHHLVLMVTVVVLIPQQLAKPKPFVQVGLTNWSYIEFRGH